MAGATSTAHPRSASSWPNASCWRTSKPASGTRQAAASKAPATAGRRSRTRRNRADIDRTPKAGPAEMPPTSCPPAGRRAAGPRYSRPPRAPSSTPLGSGGPADTVLLAHVRPAPAQPPATPAESGKDRQRRTVSWSALIEKAPVQLIGLYQTKGREADATVVVLRSNDFYGTEPAVLTRARHKTIVL